jgi:hypothetical protein
LKTIDLVAGAPSLPDLLNLASEENVILRAADGREYVLAEVDDFEREVALVRQNQELMDFLDQRSRPSKTFTIDQARELLEIDGPQ